MLVHGYGNYGISQLPFNPHLLALAAREPLAYLKRHSGQR